MSIPLKKRLLRTLVFSIIALVIGAGLGWFQTQAPQNATILKKTSSVKSNLSVAGSQIGGAFTLTDSNGNAVTESIFEGRYALIYFGFTYCPAVCPTELQKISRVMKKLEAGMPEVAAQILPSFITIDPERDTPAVMGEYISLFHPHLIGLSGDVAQTDHVKKIYRVFAKKALNKDSDDPDDYTMDHSSYIYFMGPDGDLLGIYRAKDNAAYIFEDIKSMGL